MSMESMEEIVDSMDILIKKLKDLTGKNNRSKKEWKPFPEAERQFGPFKKGDLVRLRHQVENTEIQGKALGIVVESIVYPDSRASSFCWVAWNFLNGRQRRMGSRLLERIQ